MRNITPDDDRNLLHAYAQQRSHEAFAQLAAKYAGMVFRTALRRTRDHQLAEDVTQAVFIVLARSAGTFNARESIAGWLHQTTLFAASNAMRAKARRARHEAKAARREDVPPPMIDDAPDATAIVEEQLHRLPSADRELLVLHYLQGLTMAESADAIGISLDASRKRLSRALERLRKQLSKHPAMADSMVVATALGAITAAAPQTQAAQLASAAVAGGHAGSAFTLASDLIRSIRLIALQKAAAAIAVVVLGGSVLSVAVAQLAAPRAQAPAPPPQAVVTTTQPAASPTTRDTTIMTVRGRVLGPDNRPVAGAKITVSPEPNRNTLLEELTTKPIVQAVANADGRYEISFRKSDVSPFAMGYGSSGENAWRSTMVVASADGLGLDYLQWDDVDANGDLVLTLRPDVPIEGRIVDAGGAPIPDLNVVVEYVGSLPIGQAAQRELALKDPASVMRMQRSLSVPLQTIGRDVPIVTDAQGKFHITGFGKDRSVTVHLTGFKIAYTRLRIATRLPEPQAQAVGQPNPTTRQDSYGQYSATFEHSATRGRTVQGIITDAATGLPMAGVAVQSSRFAKGNGESGLIKTVTGDDGRYFLDGFPPGQGNVLIAFPSDEQPYLMREANIEDAPGTGPITIDLELHKGIWITGKVTDKVTGQPIASGVGYTTYLDNKYAIALPEFHVHRAGRSGDRDEEQNRYRTQPDGSYRVVAVPGPALVWVISPPPQYRKGVGVEAIPELKQGAPLLFQSYPFPQFIGAVKQINVPEGAESVQLDLQLDPGLSMHVRVVDPDGKPTKGGLRVMGASEVQSADQINSGEFDVGSLAPDESRIVSVIDIKRKLGRIQAVRLSDARNGSVTIGLQPWSEITGRCLTDDGQPVANLSVEVSVLDKDADQVQTDAEGRFHAIVLPGGPCDIGIGGSGPYAGRAIKRDFTPEPGSTVDLGDMRLGRPRQQGR